MPSFEFVHAKKKWVRGELCNGTTIQLTSFQTATAILLIPILMSAPYVILSAIFMDDISYALCLVKE
jgi:hypothetical protein